MGTGLLYCSHEIYSKIDAGHFFYVISSDFSAAIDTIDHQLLLIILEKKVGLTGTETLLRVTVDGEHSSKISVGTGVPQGSVLGPILFSLYLLTLFDLLIVDSVPYHFHADDPQLFFKRSLDGVVFPIFNKIKELCSQLHLSLNKKTIITTSQPQVNTVCKVCYLELRKLYTLRSFLVSSKRKCLLRVSFSPESTTAIPYFLN